MAINAADIAAMREQGDLQDFLRSLAGRTPKPQPVAAPEPADPGYRIVHAGGWPIGSAASGPTPTHGRCACIQCDQAAVVQLPAVQRREEAA